MLNGLSGNKVAEANAPDYQKAVDQHAAYMEHLVEAIGLGEQGVYVCDADENHPDCVFVEDTAVVSSPTSAVSTSIGVESRRGEEKLYSISSPGVRCKRRVEYEKYKWSTFGWWRCSVY